MIPCYNEAEGVAQLCKRLRSLVPLVGGKGKVEVIFVDDGSRDGTADRIKIEAKGLPYRIVTHIQNRGLGAALRTGFAESKGAEVVTLDSDCTYDPMQAKDLLRTLRSGYDVVTGSPYHPRGEVVGVEKWRLFMSKSLSRFYWVIVPQRLYTYTSCFRAYRGEVLTQIHATDDGFLGVTQLLVDAILQGYKVGEIPARLTRRRFGQSKIRILRVVISHLRYLLYIGYLRLSGNHRNTTSLVSGKQIE